jgi:hypothetical protein
MILTFNSETYGELLALYQPKAITTEAENERAIAIAQELEHRSELSFTGIADRPDREIRGGSLPDS